MSLVTSVSRCAVLGLVAATACLDDARVPSDQVARRARSFSAMRVSSAAPAAGTAAGTGRHIVSFAGAVPVDFAARVHALGGTVLWVSPGSGLAVVSGLTGSTPATLASGKGIQSVDPDAVITLEVPHTALDPADAGGVASNADPTAARFFAL